MASNVKLTKAQSEMCAALDFNGPTASTNWLRRCTGFSPGHAYRVLRQCERLGFTNRLGHGLWALTPAGLEALREVEGR